MSQSFDFKRFMSEKWGDPDKLLAFLHQYGHRDVERPTVCAWFRRQSIPSDRFALLLALLKMETGEAVAVEDYLG